ncbi:hypothetical protein DYB32_008417 [Aphanomyces invadans]|uniref:Mur ligase central domain-containing protein n=1 Tax=Aphanomyces invadans TaxID=157072 RepID=A0A418B7Z8_9STRA|nr:hypothetical protein DYB32_008417 [Aphanomyces invadans]
MTTYDRLVQRLLRVNQFPHTVKMGLRNSIALHEALGSPAKHFDTIHIAGTNGKGSVSWKLAKALESSGFKTGLFVSPHVSCFRERIQVNGNLISEAQLEDLLPTIFDKSTQLAIPATFFELTTALALQHFAREEVDCVVLETGLGGRLDATNIVTPVVSVITSIGILGSTLPEIAREKAGIIKPSVPVVCGPNTQPDVMREGNETSVGAGVKAAIHGTLRQDEECTDLPRAAAAEKNSSDEEIVVVCGSVFIMAEARQALGFNEPVDSDDVKRISGVGLKTAREREASLQPK